ncbi:MAG: NAD(P)/FAD-dependent oxidoreductase [Gammaproteobacteria bacterium]|nr:NAD(P)/FAD-dependent oxidoreductase [Gammaproteobacteria bacterium]
MTTEHQYKVVIIGTGFGGIAAALRLKAAGIDDFRLLERRAFLGGTWAQNHYPGAAVDVQSPLYSLSSEPNDWTEMFAKQSELRAYTANIIEKHRLVEHCIVSCEVKSLQWLGSQQRWQINTTQGDFKAQFVINASGPLSQAKFPHLPGLEQFKGRCLHTNQWDDAVDLTGKRVAIIGTGASAAQLIPAVVDQVKSLDVFQRTPHWVMPRPDYVFKPWQRRLLKYALLQKLLRTVIYLGLESRFIAFKYLPLMLKLYAEPTARRLLKRQIKSPSLRDAVTPDYTIGCKRIILSNTYLAALDQPQVCLHSKDDPIVRITPTGAVTHTGREIELDVLICATGYQATDGLIPYEIVGEGGQSLTETWADYPRAYLGTTVPNFPNFFLLSGPNSGVGHTSAVFIIESQLNYVLDCFRQVDGAGMQSIVVRAEREAEYTARIHKMMTKTVWHWGGCQSWYQSASGKVIAMFPAFSTTFWRWTRRAKLHDHQLR